MLILLQPKDPFEIRLTRQVPEDSHLKRKVADSSASRCPGVSTTCLKSCKSVLGFEEYGTLRSSEVKSYTLTRPDKHTYDAHARTTKAIFLVSFLRKLTKLISLSSNLLYNLQVSAIEQESIDIDPDTKDLLDALDFKDLAGIVVSATPARV